MLVRSLSALHVMVQRTAVWAVTLENCRLLCLLCGCYLKGGMTLTNPERADWEGPALSWACVTCCLLSHTREASLLYRVPRQPDRETLSQTNKRAAISQGKNELTAVDLAEVTQEKAKVQSEIRHILSYTLSYPPPHLHTLSPPLLRRLSHAPHHILTFDPLLAYSVMVTHTHHALQ